MSDPPRWRDGRPSARRVPAAGADPCARRQARKVTSRAHDQTVASVGDYEISEQEFSQALRDRQEQLRAMSGGRVDPALLDSPEQRFATLEGLVRQRIDLDDHEPPTTRFPTAAALRRERGSDGHVPDRVPGRRGDRVDPATRSPVQRLTARYHPWSAAIPLRAGTAARPPREPARWVPAASRWHVPAVPARRKPPGPPNPSTSTTSRSDQ